MQQHRSAQRAGTPRMSRAGGSPWMAMLRWFAVLFLAIGMSGTAWADCTPVQTASIASNGSATFGCSLFGFDFTPITGPSHGSLTFGTPTQTSAVVYTNNGDGALSDTFVLFDFDDDQAVTFNITVGPASSIVVSPASLPNPLVGVAYSQSLSTTGGSAPYTYSLGSGSIPPGITLSSGGVISGTSTASGPHTFTVSVVDSATPTPATGNKTYTVTIPAPVLDLLPDNPPAGVIGSPYSMQFSTTGGTAPYTYTIESGLGTLPPGLSMSSAGLVSGTPTALGTYTFSLRHDDSTTISTGGEHFRAQMVSITINSPPTISVSPTSFPAANVGAAYSQTVSASGGTAPYTFAVTAGTLPAGLSLNGTSGALTGTPTAAGTFNFTVTATDNNSFTGSRAFALTVNAPTISIAPTTLPGATVAAAYSQTITASGGTAPYSYAVTAGALPAGLSLASNGALTGTPTAGGTFNFTVTATDSTTGTGPFTGSRAYSLTVSAPTISVAPTTLPGGTVGTAYGQTITASGGTASYTFAITAGALPPGLTLSSGGGLSGTPTANGTFNFTVTATDSSTGTGPYTGSRAYSLSIAEQAPVANAVSATVAHGSGANPITLNITGGAPTSVSIASAASNGTAIASGTSITYQPTTGYAGPDSFTYTATNGAGTSAPATVSITVSNPTILVVASGPLGAQIGVAYSQTFTWSGGTAPYTGFDVTGLPAGLAITGSTTDSVTVSGTPTQTGSFSLIASATDSSTGNGPFFQSQGFTLDVIPPTLVLTPPTGTLTAPYGAAYSQAFTASGGTAPYSYALNSGSLPTGMTFNTGTGTLSGTPTQTGSFPITVMATDSSTGATAPYSVTVGYTVQVPTPTIVIAPATLPDGSAGTAYSQTITASGGIGPYTFSLTAGTLPAGMTLSSGGDLSGTPTESGTFNITVQAQDANGETGSRAYTLTIAAPTLTLLPAALPNGTAGVGYNQVFSTTGGIAPYSYAVTAGALPAGLTLSAAGTLSGTTTATGSFNLSVTVTDSTGGVAATATNAYALVIDAPVITLAPATLPDGSTTAAYSQTITASGGTGPYSFSLLSGALPVGMSFSSAGVLSGTPITAGAFSLTVQATDANGFTGSQVHTLTIAAPTITLAPATLPDGLAGTAYSQTITASGGTGPYSFSLLSGALPVGMSFSSAGLLSGTPTSAGAFSFTVQATDSNGFTGALAYTLTIASPTITLAPVTLPDGLAGTAYSQAITASGGTGPYSFALLSGALPVGMSFSSAGVLSGTPITAGAFSFTVQATDSNGFTGTLAYTLTIASPTITLAPATLPDGLAGTAYSQTITASGGTGPYSFSLLSGALPVGMSFSSAGVLSGTPITAGVFSLTVQATDANGFTGTQVHTLTIASPTIALAPATLPDGVAGTVYSQTITASGGIAPYTYSLPSGSLPVGVSFSSAGVLSGTPVMVGTFNFTVRATDDNGFTGDHAYSVTVAGATITIDPPTLPSGTAGVAYSQTFSASGGVAPYTFALGGGALPPGLSLSAAGALSGTPSAAGSYSFDVTATDSSGGTPATASRNYAVVIAAGVVAVDDAFATAQNVALSDNVATNDTFPVDSTVALVTAPANGTLVLNADGSFTYTPGTNFSGSDAFTYQLCLPAPSAGVCDVGNVALTVAGNTVVANDDAASTPRDTEVSVAVLSNDTVTGAPFDLSSLSVLTNPANGTAVCDGAGNCVYTPTTGFSGSDSFRYQVCDSSIPTAVCVDALVSITVDNAVIDAVNDNFSGTPVNGSVGGTAGNAFVNDTLDGLPVSAANTVATVLTPATDPGVSLDLASGDVIVAAGTGVGSYTIVYRLCETGAPGNCDDATIQVVVAANAVTVVADTASTTQNTAVAINVLANDSTTGAPLDPATLTAPTPPGNGSLSIDAGTGVITYTPATGFSGNDSFTYQVCDGSGPGAVCGSATVSITVADPTITVTATGPLDATVGVAYSQTFRWSGGTAPYSGYSVTGLPAGLTVTASDTDSVTVSGVPTAAGSFSVLASADDSSTGNGPFTTAQSFTLVVATPTLVLDPPGGPLDAAYGVAYSQTFSASGGIAPYSYSLTGTLPPGLTFDAASATLSGVPSQPGTFAFAISVSDASTPLVGPSFTTVNNYTLTVAAPTIVLAPSTLPDGTVNTAYDQTLTATGGVGPYQFTVSAGSLPSGLVLSAAGQLTGTPTASGVFTVVITATDSNGQAGSRTYTLTIADAVPVAVDDSASTIAGQPVTVAVTDNDEGVIASVAVATAPANGSATVSGLGIVYTPNPLFFGSDSFTYAVTGPGGTSAAATVAVTVAPLPVPVGVPQTVSTLAGQPVTIETSTGASGGPFTGVTVLDAPATGTLVVSGTALVYTPAADASGSVSIRYTLNNAFGASAAITSTVNINPLPVALSRRIPAISGIAVQVELTDGARGGPFTGADLVSVLPANAGTAAIEASGSGGFRLTFKPAADFVGAAEVIFTLDNAFATSEPATITVDVTNRPDPSADAEVLGVLGAQASATRRFANAQIGNFQQRMEGMHDGGNRGGFHNGITLSVDPHCEQGPRRAAGEACRREPIADEDAPASAPAATGNGSGYGTTGSAASFWTAGVISSGDRTDRRGGDAGYEWETSGLSAGADYRVSPAFAIGGGIGYGRDDTEVGEHGTRSDATAYSIAAYASWHPGKSFFLDGLLGYQWLSFDSVRHVTGTTSSVRGERDGTQWFASVSAGYDHRNDRLTVSPYARLDLARARLDAYTEQGDPTQALHVGDQDVDTTTGNLGVRMDYRIPTGWGSISPQLRLEYQHDFDDDSFATLNYADLMTGPFYRARIAGMDRSRFMFGLGAILQTERDWLLRVEYRGLFGVENGSDQSIQLNIEKKF